MATLSSIPVLTLSHSGSFSWGAPFEGNLTQRGASGGLCNVDDFIGIDQGSAEGSGPGEDRICGTKLLEDDYVISRSKPFQLKVRSNSDQKLNAENSQHGNGSSKDLLPI